MCTPAELLEAKLTHTELQVLLTICKHDALVDQTAIAEELNLDRTTVYRATKKLLVKGLLTVSRSRRNLGKYSKNVYELSAPSHVANHVAQDATSQAHHVAPTATSTADIDIAITTDKEIKTTSLFMFAPEHKKKKKVILVGKGWQDDDADLAGFGLFDDELPAAQKQKPVSKRSGKTRNQRPHEDWTSLDVATEFAYQVYQRLPGVVNPVNTLNLQKILGKNRKEFDLNPLIELEIMRLFFADAWFLNEGRKNPHYIQGRFLKFFTSHLEQALKNLGLHSDLSMTVDQALSVKSEEFIYASDGTAFDNSMPGRKDLDKYEAKLRRLANDETTIQS